MEIQASDRPIRKPRRSRSNQLNKALEKLNRMDTSLVNERKLQQHSQKSSKSDKKLSHRIDTKLITPPE